MSNDKQDNGVERPQPGEVRSGRIDVGIEIAALASELGFLAGEYEIKDLYLTESDDEIEVYLRDKRDTEVEQ